MVKLLNSNSNVEDWGNGWVRKWYLFDNYCESWFEKNGQEWSGSRVKEYFADHPTSFVPHSSDATTFVKALMDGK